MGYPVDLSSKIAGEPGSGTKQKICQSSKAEVINGTSAVTLGTGAPSDSVLLSVTILKNAGPATASIGGFYKHDASNVLTAASFVLTGSTTEDKTFSFSGGVANTAGALTITPSVTDTVIAIYDSVQ